MQLGEHGKTQGQKRRGEDSVGGRTVDVVVYERADQGRCIEIVIGLVQIDGVVPMLRRGVGESPDDGRNLRAGEDQGGEEEPCEGEWVTHGITVFFDGGESGEAGLDMGGEDCRRRPAGSFGGSTQKFVGHRSRFG